MEKSGPDETKKSEDQSDVDESDGDETNDYQGPPISYFEFFNADFDFTFISDVAIISKNIGTVVTTWWVEMTTSSSQFVTETMSYCPEYERLFKKLVGYSGDYTVTENEKQNQQPPQHQWWWSETMSSSLLLSHKSMTSGQSCVLILSKQTISDDAEVSSFTHISSNYISMYVCMCVSACVHVYSAYYVVTPRQFLCKLPDYLVRIVSLKSGVVFGPLWELLKSGPKHFLLKVPSPLSTFIPRTCKGIW